MCRLQGGCIGLARGGTWWHCVMDGTNEWVRGALARATKKWQGQPWHGLQQHKPQRGLTHVHMHTERLHQASAPGHCRAAPGNCRPPSKTQQGWSRTLKGCTRPSIKRIGSESTVYETEDEGEDAEDHGIELGPQCTLKEQLEKDKDDESLRKWKEQLLGNVDINDVGESLEPEVKITSLSILSPGVSDIVLAIPEDGKPKGLWFTLKEGCRYSLRFKFQVSRNIVAGLKYTNNVWRTGVKVDRVKHMLGTFSPQQEAYTYDMPEETTPSGYFARGSYSAKTKFVDDDNKCYLEINYSFDIRKDWANIQQTKA
ncbi:hypothetical protein E3N88_34482 [Mikania micrantha]|uniref:Rho GDP-dissociation inhibitor 1 n=1 Tax=Mikania micrantha TaxID=192012 RepID=A0A5N6LYM5_9ASTR|nr:hypothetical protein E3N88_34482 [Mikania micrantha]